MILPIVLYTTEDSFIIFGVNIPIWFSFRVGFKSDQIVKDRWFAPKFKFMTGTDVRCLHAYVLSFRFRIRNNSVMRKIKKGSQRVIWFTSKGWTQVFDSAII